MLVAYTKYSLLLYTQYNNNMKEHYNDYIRQGFQYTSDPIREGFQEGFKEGLGPDFLNMALNGIMTALNGLGRGLNIGELITSIGNFATSTLNMARGFGQFIMGAFKIAQNTLMTIFNAIGLAGLFAFFVSFITMLAIGAEYWWTGFSSHLICAGKEFKTGWENQGYIMGILAECTWDKFLTFLDGSCTRYYIVDMTLGLLYGVFVELPLLLIRAIFGIDLQVFVDIFWNLFILPIDSIFFAISGFHLVRWDEEVIKKCYRCKGKYAFANGREVTLYKTWAEWAKLMNCSFQQIVTGFLRIFTTLIPSNKWWAWSNKRHLKPPDWRPKFFGM